MGYQVSTSGKTWRLIYQHGDREKRNVTKSSKEALELGFRSDMDPKQAKARAAQLRHERWVKDHAEREARKQALRDKIKNIRGAFLADQDVEEFERKWVPEKRIRDSHWYTVQRIIADTALHPSEWYEQSSAIFQIFVKRRYSPTYCKKLLRYLNVWGYFICKKQSKAWMKVEGPDAFWKRKIEQAYSNRISRSSSESEPITPAILEEAKTKLSEKHYNWFFLSVWFGLRPREVDNLLLSNAKLWTINKTDPEFPAVLHVFQEKLYERGIPREKCWKFIPAIFPEQKEAIEIIEAKNFKKCIRQKAKIVFGEEYTFYGGRKNFTDMLREEGYDLETASQWMGHLSVKTTEKSYSKRRKVFYRPPISAKKVA